MKRIIVISALLVSLGSFGVRAGDLAGKANSTVLSETAARNSLWRGSSSAAGLAFSPYTIVNTLDLRYDGEFGEYRQIGDGKTSNAVSLNTAGAARLGKFLVTGDFSFRNIFDENSLYNVLQYEVEDNMPYYPIDDKSSGWKRQAYELGAGLTSPVLWDRVSFGLSLDYSTKVGAKQLDPRGETYKYALSLRPSVAVNLGESVLGISGLYSDGYERSKPSNNNNWENPKIWQMRGLGESTQGKVGGNDGMKTITWRTSVYGGALQYSYSESVFTELSFTRRQVDARENPNLPKMLGTVKENSIGLDAAWIFGRAKSDKLSLDADFALTDGIEYVQKLTSTADTQEWTQVSTNSMSSYTNVSAKLSYDHLFGASDPRGYDWKVGAEAFFKMFSQSYISPASTSDAMRVYGGVVADRQFKLRGSSLLLEVRGGYAAGLGEGYTCLDTKAYDTPKAMMNDMTDYLNASYMKAGLSLDWSIFGKGRAIWIIGCSADYCRAFALDKDRLVCSAAVGIQF